MEQNLDSGYLPDLPIKNEQDDKLQRYPFAKRIAETIKNRNFSESLVIGLYGPWGFGKTSVLNFIDSEISMDSSFIQIYFNPWRFGDQIHLLNSFFITLAKTLENISSQDIQKGYRKNWIQRKVNRKNPLKTSGENIGEIMTKYSKALSFVKLDGLAQAVGTAIGNDDIDHLRQRIEDKIRALGKRIVVYIDDIDRLDKSELHAIFKLVKLTANFPNTTYILSFDESMVAESLGERFGSGDKIAGMNFLEKIIQVPLKIPMPTEIALRDYTLELVQKSLVINNIVLDEESHSEFLEKFNTGFVTRLNTPRLSIRYANSLSFSLPLLKGEVNTVDLMLIEAIKVFYPAIYEFIRTEPWYFIGRYTDSQNKIDKDKVAEFDFLFNEFVENYNKSEIASLKKILIEMFPKLNDVWTIVARSGLLENQSLNIEKRVASPSYCKRYFTYCVIKGEVSDVALDELIEAIKTDNFAVMDFFMKIINESSPEELIQKISNHKEYFKEPTSIRLVRFFGGNGVFYPNEPKAFMRPSIASQTGAFLAHLIMFNVNGKAQHDLLVEICSESDSLDFAFEIVYFCKKINKDHVLITEDAFISYDLILINRAINESGEEPIFKKLNPSTTRNLLYYWSLHNKEELRNYINNIINLNDNYISDFLRLQLPITYSSNVKSFNQPYYGDFGANEFRQAKLIYDLDYMFKKIIEKLGVNVINDYQLTNLYIIQTDENLLKQFAYFYLKDKEKEQETREMGLLPGK